jgi:integrase
MDTASVSAFPESPGSVLSAAESLTRNPTDGADAPRAKATSATRPIKTWNAEELRAFLDHVRDDRLYPFWLLAATTGMRRGELAGLFWKDVNLDQSRLAIRRSLGSVAYKLTWSEPKTDKGRRMIALDPTTTDTLRAHRDNQALEHQMLGISKPDPDVVFRREDATPIHPERISKLFGQHGKNSGLPRICFHDLRHTHATLALQAGIHPKVVSERLGHSDIAFTRNVYSHAIPALQETAASLIASLVLDT